MLLYDGAGVASPVQATSCKVTLFVRKIAVMPQFFRLFRVEKALRILPADIFVAVVRGYRRRPCSVLGGQKVTFCLAKGHILQPERAPFAP